MHAPFWAFWFAVWLAPVRWYWRQRMSAMPHGRKDAGGWK